MTDDSIAVVVSRRVPAANLEAFETALRELMQAAAKQPGQVAGDVLRGAVRGGEREYFIVYSFADERRLRAWDSIRFANVISRVAASRPGRTVLMGAAARMPGLIGTIVRRTRLPLAAAS
jgi:antibiotic biosynthesis monooxygenase (ABM) superfamily enzyme